jgi:hypothetical protein
MRIWEQKERIHRLDHTHWEQERPNSEEEEEEERTKTKTQLSRSNVADSVSFALTQGTTSSEERRIEWRNTPHQLLCMGRRRLNRILPLPLRYKRTREQENKEAREALISFTPTQSRAKRTRESKFRRRKKEGTLVSFTHSHENKLRSRKKGHWSHSLSLSQETTNSEERIERRNSDLTQGTTSSEEEEW